MNIIEASMRSRLSVFLDENVQELKPGLKDAGFKVTNVERGMSDEDIFERLEGDVIITQNLKDFLTAAVIHDFTVVAIEHIKFIDTKQDRTNKTVIKIVSAIRESQFYNRRGNWLLTIFDDGDWKLTELK